jgi:hypothetical protein
MESKDLVEPQEGQGMFVKCFSKQILVSLE